MNPTDPIRQVATRLLTEWNRLTPESLAQRIHAAQIRGRLCDRYWDPLGRYLQKHLAKQCGIRVNVYVGYHNIEIELPDESLVYLPIEDFPNLEQFVRDFDNQRFPDLVESMQS